MDALEPIHRIDCAEAAVLTWRVTWPDGTSELVHGHSMHVDREHGAAMFHWLYLGAHRIINLAHVRDIAAVTS
jgi:hypothetical protein